MNPDWTRTVAREGVEIAIVVVGYLAVELIRIQEQPITDWRNWTTGLGVGVLVRVLPQVAAGLQRLRDALGQGPVVK
jgi:hypothetical protein